MSLSSPQQKFASGKPNTFPGTKPGLNGVTLISSGIFDLDRILCGGIPVGSVLLVLEDSFAPHHLVILRYFLSQGICHRQPLFLASSLPDPKSFLGTLPSIAEMEAMKNESSRTASRQSNHGLRIAFQYQQFVNDQDLLLQRRTGQQASTSSFHRGNDPFPIPQAEDHPFCSNFDMRKPMDKASIASTLIECHHIGSSTAGLQGQYERISRFYASAHRSGERRVSRVCVQSLGAPQCQLSNDDSPLLLTRWFLLLRELVRANQSVALVTVPASTLSTETLLSLEHMADIVLSLHSLKEEDKTMAGMIPDYADSVGLVKVQKLAPLNSMVPAVLDTTTYVMKAIRRRRVVLETLQQVPVEVSPQSGPGKSAASTACGGPAAGGDPLDF